MSFSGSSRYPASPASSSSPSRRQSRGGERQHLDPPQPDRRYSDTSSRRFSGGSGTLRPQLYGSNSSPRIKGSTPIPNFEEQDAIKNRIDSVLANKKRFLKSAEASFHQFDMDGNGKLDLNEFRQLIHQLIHNLQLPPLNDSLLRTIFKRYDFSGTNAIDLQGFLVLYWAVLTSVKEKFYPTRSFKTRRSCFVGERNLSGNQTIHGLLSFEKRLGAGSFGEVFLVREKASGLERVCKIINKDLSKIPIEQIDSEIAVLKRLDHPNIIKIFDVYSDFNSIYIIMEICDGGELQDRITKTTDQRHMLSEQYISNIMRQLLEAVNYFHSNFIAHKDLKPENILFQNKLADSPIKVIDFGLAEMFDRQEAYSQVAAGTYLYMAPEVLDYIVTLKCDIWSCGCLLFFLFAGEVPFPGNTIEEVEYRLRNCEPQYNKLDGLPISRALIDLLHQMLRRDYNLRFTAQQCLEHQWIKMSRHSDVALPQQICLNLQRYRRQSNLKNVLTNMLAHQLNVSGNQIREIIDIFKLLDADGNGILSKSELATGLNRVGFSNHEITQIINALDIDGSDSVSYTEFLAACYTWRELELNVVWTTFCKMDRDGDGKISIDEFIQCLSEPVKQIGNEKSMKPKIAPNEKELRKIIAEIDRNKDGLIDWNEFLQYMKR